jgi:hypothetical protein
MPPKEHNDRCDRRLEVRYFTVPGLSSIYENLGAGNNIASDYPDLDE